MTNFLTLMLGYFFGLAVSVCIFRPMKNWQEGYDTAKEHYGDWNRGFDAGYTAASKRFKDYHQGFGDGFEAGWDSALTQEKTIGSGPFVLGIDTPEGSYTYYPWLPLPESYKEKFWNGEPKACSLADVKEDTE